MEALYTALVDLQHSVHVVLGIFSPRNPSDIRKYTAEAFKRTQDVYSGYLKAKIFMAPLTCEKIERVLTMGYKILLSCIMDFSEIMTIAS